MNIEILYFYDTAICWFSFYLYHFGFWITTEKWWADGNKFAIGIRFGKKIFERKW